MVIASIAAIAQPISGDLLARRAHVHQAAKLAAMEGQFVTERGAPLRIGGWPDVEAATRATRWSCPVH